MNMNHDLDCEPGESIVVGDSDRAVILAALYNGVHYQHKYFSGTLGHVMTADEAREILKSRSYFDYLNGRPMKVDLSRDTLNLAGYNFNNGSGRGPRVIREALSQEGDT